MRAGRQTGRRHAALRWGAAVLALGAGAAVAIAVAPAQADTATVDAQLSLSGVATQGNILGGTTIGVKPGTTVRFQASALPTAGLDNIPTLGPLLRNLLDTLTGSQFQVVASFPASFPGGARTLALGGPKTGPCAGTQVLPITFNSVGTYGFSWKVQYVAPGLLGGCKANSLNNSDLNLLKGAGVALNATNQWVGQIVVATDPPPPGISVQLPGIGVQPSLPVVGNLPTISVPNINVPTIPVNVPSIVSGLPIPGGGNSTTPGGGGGGTQPGNCVPCSVVPSPQNFPGGGGFGNPGPDSGSLTQLGAGLHEPSADLSLPSVTATATNPGVSTSTKRINLAANKAPAAQMPVILAIIAIIALGLVTATYARLYLLRRNVT